MKTAVVFFSLTGNTAKIAKLLAIGDTDLIEVKGSLKLLSIFGVVKFPVFEAGRYDLIILGCPLWYEVPALPFLKIVRHLDFGGKQVNIFMTYALTESKGLKTLSKEVKARNGHVGRMMMFDMRRKISEHEVRKLLSF